jgi:hypothetical protein
MKSSIKIDFRAVRNLHKNKLNVSQEEETGGWRKMLNDKFHSVFFTKYHEGDKIKEEMGGRYNTHGRDET